MPPVLKIEGATARHNAKPTPSVTLNHVRGPSSQAEIDELKEKRAKLVVQIRALTTVIADAELVQLMAGV